MTVVKYWAEIQEDVIFSRVFLYYMSGVFLYYMNVYKR